jgi:hypothetical protein
MWRHHRDDQDERTDSEDGEKGLELPGTDVDWDVLRGEVYRVHTRYDEEKRASGVRCAWCGEITHTADLHEALVKRSRVPKNKQHLIFVKENVVPVCHDEHLEHGQTKEMTKRALDILCKRVGARYVGQWYISLWEEHGLSVPKGLLMPRKMVTGPTMLMFASKGAELDGAVLPYDGWMVKSNTRKPVDWRVWVGTKRFMNYNPKWARGRIPSEKNGIAIDTMVRFIEDGYYYDYLAGIFA